MRKKIVAESDRSIPYCVGDIADALQTPVSKIRYACRKLGLEPIGRAGNSSLYSFEQAEVIAQALRSMRRLRPDSWTRGWRS